MDEWDRTRCIKRFALCIKYYALCVKQMVVAVTAPSGLLRPTVHRRSNRRLTHKVLTQECLTVGGLDVFDHGVEFALIAEQFGLAFLRVG